MHRNRFTNGRFVQDLDGWTVSGATYLASVGDDHFGVASLSTGGDYIEQDFVVSDARIYSLNIEVQSASGALTPSEATLRITDDQGNTIVTTDLTEVTGATWENNLNTYGLVPGGTYTLRITNVSADAELYVDDIWLWFVPMTRAEIATRVHSRLGALATDKSFSTTSVPPLTEGSYTYPIDDALRALAAVDLETGLPEVRYLDEDDVPQVLDLTEIQALESLQFLYSSDVDIKLGQRAESRSQQSRNINSIIRRKGSSGGGVVTRALRRETNDYDYN